MAEIKLIIGNEERDILRFSTGYFEPNPLDPCWVSESMLSKFKKEGVIPEDYQQPNPLSLKDFRKYKVSRPLSAPVVSFYDPCPFGGILNLTMESTDNDDFFYHAFRNEKWLNGRIEVYNVFSDLPFRRFEFWDACIIEISERFEANSGMPMLLNIEFSPATLRVDRTVVFQKSWYMTEINAPIPIYKRESEVAATSNFSEVATIGIGDQVLPPLNSRIGRFINAIEPRIYRGFPVDSDGYISGPMRPLGGALPIGPGGAAGAVRLVKKAAQGTQVARTATSINQLNRLVRTGRAPAGITRFDRGRVFGEVSHVHFSNGAALNINGTWKHGSTVLTNQQIKFLTRHGWTIP
jgi:hypothetical protein